MSENIKTSATLNTKEKEFLKIFLEGVKNDKSISENQKEIVRLNKIENRSLDDNKKLKILLKAEKIVFDEKIKNEKLQSKIDDDILKTIKKLLFSKIEVRDLFSDLILEKQFKDNDSIKKYIESLPPVKNEKSDSSDTVYSKNEKSDSTIENQNEAIEDKNYSDVASSEVAQTYSVEDAVVVPDDN